MVVTVIKKPASADEKCYMAGVEGFEPPHDGTRTRCLTTWRHPIAVDTVAQAGVVFKLFALKLLGFYSIAHSPSFLLFIRRVVAYRQANKFSSFAREMSIYIELFILSLR